jgi:allantoin racemase
VRLLVLNVNTSATITATIECAARAAASEATEIVATEPRWGPESVEGYYDSFLSAAALLDRLKEYPEPFDALIWAGFGEHGYQGAQELLTVPVIDVTHAAALMACLVGRKYGIVTTLARSVALIEDNLRLAGLLDRCASIRATGLSVLELDRDPEATGALFVAEARACVDAGADVICLGCAGVAGIEQRVTTEVGAPVVDGIGAAVKLAEACVSLGLQTSKVGALADPLPKARTWPGGTGS